MSTYSLFVTIGFYNRLLIVLYHYCMQLYSVRNIECNIMYEMNVSTYSGFVLIDFIILLLIILHHYCMQLYSVPYRPGRLQLPWVGGGQSIHGPHLLLDIRVCGLLCSAGKFPNQIQIQHLRWFIQAKLYFYSLNACQNSKYIYAS